MSGVRDALFVGLLCLAAFAAAQDEERAEPVSLDVSVLFGSAYRVGTWSPVDVIVKNDGPDISGWIDAKYEQNWGRSPMYRIPCDVAKGSRKRFRYLYPFPPGLATLQVGIVQDGLPVCQTTLPMPTPIYEADLLGLVLADTPSDFGFLHAVADPDYGIVRFHQVSLRSEELAALPDYAEGYEACNAVILGDIDIDRMASLQREALRGHIESGGLLVVCPGLNLQQYKRSWVADMLGIEFGTLRATDMAELARAAFPGEALTDLDKPGKCSLLELIPKSPAVKQRGANVALATLNPVGGGYVATVAVGSSPGSLKDYAGYIQLWRELCAWPCRENGLDFDQAFRNFANSRTRSGRSSVFSRGPFAVYLLLYFAFAIAVNWFACRAARRPGLVWLNLTVIAVAFTLFAARAGLPGTQKVTNFDQMDIVCLPERGTRAEVHTFVEVASVDTPQYSILADPHLALVEKVETPRERQADTFGGHVLLTECPQVFSGSLRRHALLRAHLRGLVDGFSPIEGNVTLDGERFEGLVRCRLPLPLDSAFALLRNRYIPLRRTQDGWQLSVSAREMAAELDRRTPRDKAFLGLIHLPYEERRFQRAWFIGYADTVYMDGVGLDVPVNKTSSGTLVVAFLRLWPETAFAPPPSVTRDLDSLLAALPGAQPDHPERRIGAWLDDYWAAWHPMTVQVPDSQ
ncbi:MAG TPA: hypothetical protein HPP77_04945 [Candidatus Hydrogenedentes bacterium]|nr:hypothetical protein [Candidatus Hydrogenedentota bacterium]